MVRSIFLDIFGHMNCNTNAVAALQHRSPSMAAVLQLAPLLVLLLMYQAAHGTTICPPCGKLEVPYPLSTGSSCGHPLYPLTCTPTGVLQIRALTGYRYPVQSIDASARTMVIGTGEFIGNSCMTRDVVSSGQFSLDPSGPFSISPNNTVLFLNASSDLLFSQFACGEKSFCVQALTVFPQKSCRYPLCCSLAISGAAVLRHEFIVRGLATGFVSLVNWVSGSQPSSWRFGLQLQWDEPHEPPCSSDSHCGANSACLSTPATNHAKVCLCNKGYFWESNTGTCPRVPYCVRNNISIECHKGEYAIGLTLVSVGLIVFASLTGYAYKKRRSARIAHAKVVRERSMILAANSGGKSARLFSSREMKRATNNFARDRLLGCGGFGEVHKGFLDNGLIVAIKSAKIGNIKGIEQVLNEVRVLSLVNHRNLVRLLGCCVDSELPLMVYEYVPNGNLHDHLHGLKKSFLDWRTRLLIGLQSAEGLAYLHSATYPPIYHRDVKSSNILLDKSMNAQVADFGLSRLIEPNLTHVSTCAHGTLGYLDPEYYRNYKLTDKSDVYSFGVVLLELVTSKRAIDFGRSPNDVNLVVMVQSRIEQNMADDVMDPELVDGASADVIESIRNVINLALACLQESRLDRPSMKEVSEKLQSIISTLAAVADKSFERGTFGAKG